MTDNPKPTLKGKPKPPSKDAIVDLPREPQLSLRYTGSADRRVMTVKDMQALGVASSRDLVWSRDNNFTLSSPALSKDAFDALIKLDGFDIA